jgi:PAS domain S-box-containing protein
MDDVENSCEMGDSLFKLLCESVPQQLWAANAEGGLIYVNKRVLDYFQLPAEQMLGDGWLVVVHPDDVPVFLTKWTHAVKSSEPFKVDFRLKGADGVYRWHIGQALAQMDETGRVLQWFGSITDITDHKETEEALLTASQLLDQSQKIAKVGGWELDLISGDLFWTAETYRLHDTTPNDFNRTVEAGIEHYLPGSQKILTKALNAAINEGKDYDLELETMTAKGRKIDVRTTCSVTVENGK